MKRHNVCGSFAFVIENSFICTRSQQSAHHLHGYSTPGSVCRVVQRRSSALVLGVGVSTKLQQGRRGCKGEVAGSKMKGRDLGPIVCFRVGPSFYEFVDYVGYAAEGG